MQKSFAKMKRWLLQEPEEPRRSPRLVIPEIVVHYWDGAAPEGREIRDISDTGAYIFTGEQWYPGTIVRIIIQKPAPDNGSPPNNSICVTSRVVRQGVDGVAVEFIFREKEDEKAFRNFLAGLSAQSSPRSGQALLEYALVLPLIFLLAVNAINFGGFLFGWITVAGAARSGAQYMVMSTASVGSVTAPTTTQISSLITSDVTSLLNKSSIAVSTCKNATASSNACTTLTDPEAPSYTLAALDVTYTYNPFIPLFSFPRLNISATLPSGTIHRKVVMRMLQ